MKNAHRSKKSSASMKKTLLQMRDARFLEATQAEREGRFSDAIDLELAAYRLNKDAQAV